MSLQVWLPLNGDTVNYGLDEHEFKNQSSSGATVADAGKIGKCYNFVVPSAATANIYSDENGFMNKCINNHSFSLCGWFTTTSSSAPLMFLTYGVGLRVGNAAGTYLFLYNSSRSVSCVSSIAVNNGKWHHIAGTYNVETNKLNIYIDGVNTGTADYPEGYTYASSWTNGLYIGRNPNNTTLNTGYYFSGNVNDIRIYDHCLTPKEVKEISKGLIAHYPLKDIYNSSNLIINGFGELGTENWTKTAYVSTTETPSADPSIKASFYNSNSTVAYTLINVNHSHTISGYFKSTGATSGTVYPSILPYDADKKFIYYHCCRSGFNNAYKTTLSQPLKKGDTVIHATDLSAWTTGDNYYIHVAVFGYRDSYGTLYPDMEYTADCPAFASSTSDKSHIDKTNNTITLLAAFTGEDRPAGTTICQSSEGSTNYYPFGGIALSSLSDWVFKTVTLVPFNIPRLKYARYIKWMTYSNVYNAGIKIVDNDAQTSTVYDVSGYKHNGNTWSYDTAGQIVMSKSGGRYDLSTFINSDNNTTNTASGTRYIYCNCPLTTPECLTVAFWCKPIAGYGGTTTQGQFCLTNNEIGDTAGTDYNTAPMNHRDGAVDINSVATVTHIRPTIDFTANEWHHYAFTYDGRYGKSYKDGILSDTKDMGSNKTLGDMKGIVIGFSRAGNVWRSNKSHYSDFRFYVTALSADDIKELYQASVHIDKDNCYSYEFVEG